MTTLDELFRRSATAMILADGERRIRDVNDAACELLRATRAELVKLRLDDLAPDGQRRDVADLWAAFVSDGTQSGPFLLAARDGTTIGVAYSAIANVDGDLHLGALVPADGDAPKIERELDATAGAGGAERGRGARLTPREHEVITLLALGLTSGEIAEKLVISPETVRIHVRNARRRLGARTRAQAIALALRSGQIRLPAPGGLFLA
jgi:PAS domain S-box-containing protein